MLSQFQVLDCENVPVSFCLLHRGGFCFQLIDDGGVAISHHLGYSFPVLEGSTPQAALIVNTEIKL